MLRQENLKDLLSSPEYSRREKLLLCMATEASRPKSVREVRQLAVDSGLTQAKRWNVSDILSRAKGLAIRTSAGWELTGEGRRVVSALAGAFAEAVTPQVSTALRHHLTTVADEDTRRFIDEAVRCYENGLLRSAVVLSWVGAVAVLQDHVLAHRLSDFNAEAARRDSKWRRARTRDDLGRMKEYDFLQVLEAMSILGKSVKQELEACLRLRNGCGHPSSLRIGDARVAGHLEILIQNVFGRF